MNDDKKEMTQAYQIGARIAKATENDKKLNVSELVSIAREKKSMLNLLIKWDEASDEKKADLLEQIKAKMPKKKGPFGK